MLAQRVPFLSMISRTDVLGWPDRSSSPPTHRWPLSVDVETTEHIT